MFKDKYELNLLYEDYFKRVNDLKECLNINSLNNKIKELEELTNSDGFWDDASNASKIVKELGHYKNNITSINKLISLVSDFKEFMEYFDDKESEELLEDLDKEIAKELDEMELKVLLSSPFDDSCAIVEIHPGAGGVEAHDWASMLYRMYQRYCELEGFKIIMLDYQAGEEAGIKSVSFEVSGEYAYGLLKSEKGVHRLVRISPFDSNKRRHTSFASVDITPKFSENIEVDIKDEDLKVDTYRASGAGGQHINKTDSAVRITHIPTGIVASCQTQRSQIQNREYCMSIIKSKLYEKIMNEKMEELAKLKGENLKNEWGSQIRSYVFCPYTMVKDHRSNYEVSDVSKVMDGDIKDFVSAYLKIRSN